MRQKATTTKHRHCETQRRQIFRFLGMLMYHSSSEIWRQLNRQREICLQNADTMSGKKILTKKQKKNNFLHWIFMKNRLTPVKLTTSKQTFSEAHAFIKQRNARGSPAKKSLNTLLFERSFNDDDNDCDVVVWWCDCSDCCCSVRSWRQRRSSDVPNTAMLSLREKKTSVWIRKANYWDKC